MLSSVAAFFRRTEPHSPLSYSLDQAVRWGRLPLPELLKELIGDQSTRNEFFKLSGIPIPEDESGY
jgi:type VI secretion system protein ImpA